MSGFALGLDLGTSGLRTAVVDETGRVLAKAQAEYGPAPEDRRNPLGWWDGTRRCLAAQMHALRAAGHDPAQICRIAIDGTSGSVVLVDGALAPVSRALMYDDGGLEREAQIIARYAPESHLANGPGSALARTLRLWAETPKGSARHLCHQADFIAAKLHGASGVTDYNNALKTGLDPETGEWPEWLSSLPLPRIVFPRAVAPGTPIGPVRPDLVEEFGLGRDCVVHAGTTDSIAAFLASSPVAPGAAVTSLGTTLAIKLCGHKRIDAPELGLYAHKIRGLWLLGGASNTGGGVLKHYFSAARLTELSARIDPMTPSDLDYYPLLKPGERFPVNDPALLPRLTPRPENDIAFLHGLLESIARIEKRGYDLLVEMGAEPPKLILTAGGGAANAVWTALRARVLGVPIQAAEEPDAAVGVARLALSA